MWTDILSHTQKRIARLCKQIIEQNNPGGRGDQTVNAAVGDDGIDHRAENKHHDDIGFAEMHSGKNLAYDNAKGEHRHTFKDIPKRAGRRDGKTVIPKGKSPLVLDEHNVQIRRVVNDAFIERVAITKGESQASAEIELAGMAVRGKNSDFQSDVITV